jgi:hypothetical protein
MPSTSSTSVVAAVGPAASTPQGVRHRRLQLRWWPLSDLPSAPPRGSAIDVFNFDGGRCRTCRQHPQGVRHRRLQLWWWPLLDLPPAPLGCPHRHLQLLDLQLRHLPRARHHRFLALMVGATRLSALAIPGGPPSTFLSVDGGRSRTSSSGTSRGAVVNYRVKSSRQLSGAPKNLPLPVGSQPLPRLAQGPLSVP